MNLKINENLRFIRPFLSNNLLSYRTFCFLSCQVASVYSLVLVVNFWIAGFDAGPKAFDPLLGSVRVSRLLLIIVGLNVASIAGLQLFHPGLRPPLLLTKIC